MPVSKPPPTVEHVAANAHQILSRWEGDPDFAELCSAALQFSADRTRVAGFTLISQWSRERDAGPLVTEALRALAIKSAGYLATADLAAAEVPIPAPVEEMVHALLAQVQLLGGITDRTGAPAIQQTDLARSDYHHGCTTHSYYTAAWGEEPPPRYWIDHHEVDARRAHLRELFERIGVHGLGRHHAINFAAAAA